MCGIVLVGSKLMTAGNINLFEKLLYCDVFRGPHSTGVMTQRQYGYGKLAQAPEVNVVKAAMPAAEYLDTPEWQICRNGVQKVNKLGNFYVGHNRYATMGAINGQNAHPFQHGNITLVHNGTLNNQSLLPDSKSFAVDSENVCHSINKIGAAETIQKLDGAFTLIWHDASDNTLHIIRNDERPFHLAETTTGDWYGASEEEMLMWILKRGKFGQSIKSHFEIEVGKEYIFNTTPGNFDLLETVDHILPVFTKAWGNWNYGTGSSSFYQNRYTPKTDLEKTPKSPTQNHTKQTKSKGKYSQCNDILKAAGIKKSHGDYLTFTPHNFGAYSGTPEKGMIEGYLQDTCDYIEIQSHNASIENSKAEFLRGKIVGAFMELSVPTILIDNASTVTEPDLSADDDLSQAFEIAQQEEEEFQSGMVKVMQNGEHYTRAKWEHSQHSSCGNCSSVISFEDSHRVPWFNGEPICSGCYDDLVAQAAEEEFVSKSLKVDKGYIFPCQICGESTELHNESDEVGVCKGCKPFPTPKKVKPHIKLKNKPLSTDRVCGEGVEGGTLTGAGCGLVLTNGNRFFGDGKEDTKVPLCAHCWSENNRLKNEKNKLPVVVVGGEKRPTLSLNKKNKRSNTGNGKTSDVLTKNQKRLNNGMVVNKKVWRKMNECSCGYKIPFVKASDTLMSQDSVICEWCAAKLI